MTAQKSFWDTSPAGGVLDALAGLPGVEPPAAPPHNGLTANQVPANLVGYLAKPESADERADRIDPAAVRNPPAPDLPLHEKYRPRRLADVVGQPDVVRVLSRFAAKPRPQPFLFSGPTGTGKTSAARALAVELGVEADRSEFGGLYEIPSGDQDGAAVREQMRQLWMTPFAGSGWKMLIVNEADNMTAQARALWHDLLEGRGAGGKGGGLAGFPPRSVIVFTTNYPDQIPAAIRTRCVHLRFTGEPADLRESANDLIRRVWAAENGQGEPPTVDDLADAKAGGKLTFRGVMQSLAPLLW